MAERRELLIEIGTEELPPKSLARLAAAFETEVSRGLVQAGLSDGATERFFSPRRLAVKAAGVLAKQPDQVQHRRGPAVQAAFDKDGNPTRAAEGFARSVNKSVAELGREKTAKGEWLACELQLPGRPLAELLPDIVREALKKLPIPKRMRWGAGEAEFVRPVHWIVLLHGGDVIDGQILGVPAGRETRGHRFHCAGPIRLAAADEYPARLERDGRVRVNAADNRLANYIADAARAEAKQLGGQAVGVDGELPDEVAALNEWPVPVVGAIPERFLALPEEVLITTLEVHQRYFPVRGPERKGEAGRLLPHFITFANIDSKQPQIVQRGNERVVVPRLEDALFFWETDRRRPLAERTAQLADMVFQKKLGTLADKQARVAALAGGIARSIGGDPSLAERAAQLAKCDLLTEMVGEFPELQGTMGRYYAAADGEPAELAAALEEQYRPRFAGDRLPETKTGQALAVADKLDTVCGIFALGKKPGGDKDPFALRRAALGLLRIVIECRLDVDLHELVGAALQRQPVQAGGETAAEINDFFLDRLRAWYLEQNVRYDVFDAVRSVRPARPLDFDQRIQAVNAFVALPEAAALAAANKRIGNILRKAPDRVPETVDPGLLQEKAEQDLNAAVEKAQGKVAPLAAKRDYTAVLKALAGLRDTVDRFFDEVMVMAEDEAVRANRLALLCRISDQFGFVADISQLQTD